MEENTAALLGGIAALGLLGAGVVIYLQQQEEKPPCDPGDTMTYLCPDGSTIVVAECVDEEWTDTGLRCGGNGGNGGPGPDCQDGEVQYKQCSYGGPVVEKRCFGGQWFETGLQCTERPIGLQGRVNDVSDARGILAACIRMTGRTTGAIFQTYSDHEGHYVINDITPDFYDILISADGYLPVKHINVDFRVPPWVEGPYDFGDLYNGMSLRLPGFLTLNVNPISVQFEGGHWCCGHLKPKSRHTRPLVTATVYDNDPYTPTAIHRAEVHFIPSNPSDGCFFCRESDKYGYGDLVVKTDNYGKAMCYYFCRTEKDMQRFFNAEVVYHESARGRKYLSPPISVPAFIQTTGAAIGADKTCYGGCEKTFHTGGFATCGA